nr:hypothetical protein [Shewanella xiamenensis]
MITLYGMPRSRALRVAWVLEELGASAPFLYVTLPRHSVSSFSLISHH